MTDEQKGQMKGYEIDLPAAAACNEVGGRAMTREEAIKHIMAWMYATSDLPPKQVAEALDLALAVLRGPTREQSERMRGKWAKHEYPHFVYCTKCNYGTEPKQKKRFCPNCGAPMTDEAVSIMLRRWKEAVDDA